MASRLADMSLMLDRRFSVAPMMDCTDRFFRTLVRLISARTLLYTEMVTTGAVIHGDRDKLLGFEEIEHPVALQLGGADPDELAAAARIGAGYGYDEINLNVGCPSDRVQSGRFGACLMAEPETVRGGVAAMIDAVDIPVTVKTRIGIDDRDSYAHLRDFVGTVAGAGCKTFIIHARKAWLTGLSPKENRTVPPLRYDVAARLKADFPDLEIIVNGGVETLESAETHLETFDGVMIGRAAYGNPFMMAEADARIFGGEADGVRTREDVLARYEDFIARWLAAGVPLKAITRHMTGLFHARPGGRVWRRHLAEHAHKPGAGIEVVRGALGEMEAAAAAARETQRAAAAA